MKTYDVTIKDVIVTVMRVEADNKEEAYDEAHEAFSEHVEPYSIRFDTETLEVTKVDIQMGFKATPEACKECKYMVTKLRPSDNKRMHQECRRFGQLCEDAALECDYVPQFALLMANYNAYLNYDKPEPKTKNL